MATAPPVFRTGEHRPIGTGNELDRIILYLPARSLDLAEALAEKAGVPAIQDYCGRLLNQAIESEQDRQKVIGIEARRGPLEGLKQIAGILITWRNGRRIRVEAGAPAAGRRRHHHGQLRPGRCGRHRGITRERGEGVVDRGSDQDGRTALPGEAGPVSRPDARRRRRSLPGQRWASSPTRRPSKSSGGTSDSAGMTWAFLPCLRRGDAVPTLRSAELIRALDQLEMEHRGAEVLDRRMAHALHRLALESQVLLTDAWPGVFDARMIAAIRTVQEAVERILSGQDIRY